MIGDALSYPRAGDDWLGTLLIGGVLSLFAVLVLPAVVLAGYSVRFLRSAAHGEHLPPSFSDWTGLLVDGLTAVAIGFVYALVPVAVSLVAASLLGSVAGLAVLGGMGASPPGMSAVLGGVHILGLLAVLVGLAAVVLAVYTLPAALTAFAVTGSFLSAVSPSRVTGRAFTREYLLAWVVGSVVGVVLGAIGLALSFLLVGVFVLFYGQVVVHYVFGRGYARAGGDDADAS